MADQPAPPEESLPTAALVDQLQADRLWLLRQLDAGAWPQWRLDLAALERELGELLEQVRSGTETDAGERSRN